jgi:membrane fusion protein (multidrug efflux system)
MAEEQTGNNQKKKKAFLIVGAIVLIGLIGAHFYTTYRKTHVSTDDAFIDGNIHTIAAKINGTVKVVHVKDNQPVKKGDLLVELEPTDYTVKLREASSVVGAEKAKLDEAGTRIASAKANLELQRANLKLAELEKTRAESLYQKEVLPRDRYDRAMTAYEVGVAQVKAAEEQLRSAEAQKLTQASTIKQKEATAAMAELNYQYTKLYAPIDGYVTKKSVQTGNQIQAGQPLMAVVGLSDIWVTANFKETQMEHIRPGQTVKMGVDSYPGMVFKGKVDSIMAGTGVTFSLFPAENATGNYVKVVQRIPVKIVFDEGAEKNHILRVGMSVEPTILTK